MRNALVNVCVCCLLSACNNNPSAAIKADIPSSIKCDSPIVIEPKVLATIKPSVTKENYQRIVKCMHVSSVKQLLGSGGFRGVEGSKSEYYYDYFLCWGDEPGDYVTVYFDGDLVCHLENSKGW